MTREEAINVLDRLRNPEPYEPQITEVGYDALTMAINALKVDVKAMREEIERADEGYNSCDPQSIEYVKADILAIIDKYMGVKDGMK